MDNQKQIKVMTGYAVLAGLITPVMLLASVPRLRRLTHGQPGGWSGFRTARSTSSIENWQLAQTLSANHFMVIGMASLVIAILAYLVLLRRKNLTLTQLWWFTLIVTSLPIVALIFSAIYINSVLPH